MKTSQIDGKNWLKNGIINLAETCKTHIFNCKSESSQEHRGDQIT